MWEQNQEDSIIILFALGKARTRTLHLEPLFQYLHSGKAAARILTAMGWSFEQS